MPKQTYEIVEHDGGFAYRVGDVYSETYATHRAAHDAAERAAQRQRRDAGSRPIEYQDAQGRWRTEIAQGDRSPETEVFDPLLDGEQVFDRRAEKATMSRSQRSP
jgi:hypothetical protein